MPAITLEAIEAKHNEVAEMIAKFKAQPEADPVLHRFGEVEIKLYPGEHYAGMVLDKDGQILHHLVLMAQRPDKRLNWKAALDWAEEVGGALPDRQEQALLYANCKPHLEAVWHWSSEEHEDDASYAWGCIFYHGFQGYTLKSYDGAAVAVRRV